MFFGKKKPAGTELKIHFHVATTEQAQKAFAELSKIYGNHTAEEAEVIIPLGGDGTMLQAMHKYHHLNKPFYGMNLGTLGFLLNPYDKKKLFERIAAAKDVKLHPLQLTAHTMSGEEVKSLAFNEVALVRERAGNVEIRVYVNGKEPLEQVLVGDGVMLSTPGGSTAYNSSAHGPIIPIGANVLALTPISPSRPRHWNGALLPIDVTVRFEVVNAGKRPVRAEWDGKYKDNVAYVDIHQQQDTSVTLMFDPDHNLEDRIIREQFALRNN